MPFLKSDTPIGRRKYRLTFAAGLLCACLFLVGIGASRWGVVSAAADCDNNAVIYCGFSSKSNFISKVKANNSGNGHSDLQAIYAAFGLEPAEYDRFVSYARPGTAYKDGRIVVDGKTVATNAKSIGRLASYHGSDYFTQTINGTKYYGNVVQKTFASSSIPVEVLFNSQGAMEFAVLESCGNPITGTLIKPSYGCTSLHKTPVTGKPNTYQFTTSASASNNASIAKVVYDFGDGTKATASSPSTPITHTYTKSNTYTAKVTVYVNLPGNQQVMAVSVNCQTTIQVQVPFYQCAQLTGAILDRSKQSYSFTAIAKYGGGAAFTSADFTFGDGKVQTGVKPANSNATTVTVTHAYAAAGTYNANAVLHFTVDGKDVTAAACPAMVTPTSPPTPECKPGIPVGSPACSPCQYDASLPSDSPDCVPTPASLPNTGAGDVIAIFAVVVVGGFLVYRQLLFRKHVAAFTAAERGTSPLPLQNPLDEGSQLNIEAPAPRRHSLRRRRPF